MFDCLFICFSLFFRHTVLIFFLELNARIYILEDLVPSCFWPKGLKTREKNSYIVGSKSPCDEAKFPLYSYLIMHVKLEFRFRFRFLSSFS